MVKFNSFRASVLHATGFIVAALLISESLLAQGVSPGGGGRPGGGGGPIGTPDGAPSCPEYLLGQIDGCYYYATSDCKGQTGYGQSPVLIPLPQCVDGVCGRKVSTPGGPPEAPETISEEELNGWKTSISESLAQFDKEISIRSDRDSRRRRLSELKVLGSATLRQLDSKQLSAKQKFLANANFNKRIGDYMKATERVGLASGFSGRPFTIEDRPMLKSVDPDGQPRVMQSAAGGSAALSLANEVTFDVSATVEQNKSVRPAVRYSAKSEKRDVLKVPAGGGRFVYFQTFALTVQGGANAAPTTLLVGVQVQEAANAKDAYFSERGNYAHRVIKDGTPYLVNSVDSLGATP